MSDTAYFDSHETREPEVRESDLFAALRGQIAHAKASTSYFGDTLADVDPAAVIDRAVLAQLPVLRKSALIELQRQAPPFGGMVSPPISELSRLFISPGPIYEPEGRRADYWRLARALFAAGIRKGDLVHNCFAYHLTPAGAMLESAAHALGCPVIPAGPGNTEQQVAVIEDLKPSAYIGVPDFLKILLDKAKELDRDASSIGKALVSGAALPPSLRDELQARGVGVLQCYATADLGLIGYETQSDGAPCEGMMIDEDIIVEIVRPGTGDPVTDGEVGEVVVTTLNPDHPLIRFATGDLSAVLPGASPCGRTNMRIKGWMGRADQTTKVKGMFVRPEQVDAVVKRHPEIVRARLVVSRDGQQDAMTLSCEADRPGAEIADAVAATVTDVTKLKATIEMVAPGTLANDGKVIEDTRPID
ncbi:MAG: AMP-binding protein [Alphaproteobacteria bacterium]|nr:AMP-binding protein [Alphaproteobacteria bacterium]